MLDHVAMTLKGGPIIKSRTVPCDLTESIIAAALSDIQDNYADVEIGSYPLFMDGKHGVNLVLRGADDTSLSAAEQNVIQMIKDKKA